MKSDKVIATYRRLRTQPLWKLLAADNASIVLGLLQTHLYEKERSLSASIFLERIGRDLERLRIDGEYLPQPAQHYIAEWLAAGYLTRRFPAGAAEEEYELTPDAADAIRIISDLAEPRSSATESRLVTVMQQLVRLAEETDPNPRSRIAALVSERERIDREIQAIQEGRANPLANDRAIERTRDLITLASDLAGDFRRVRDHIEQLNRDLREEIVNNEGSRGEVLQALFAGVDLIAESDAGKTFSAFWQLLIDPEQSATLEQAIDQVLSRDFAGALDVKERRFLQRLITVLLDEGGSVHDVFQNFARSLKQFVQSREFLEQRRLNQLLSEARRAALTLKDQVKAFESLEYTLPLTSSRLTSISQWTLYDPALQATAAPMVEAGEAPISLEAVGELVAQSEIDFRTLKANVQEVLQEHSQASIADVLRKFPAAQGLGSVLGLLALGSRHGFPTDTTETVFWHGTDGQARSARIPTIFFLKDRADELA